MTLTNKTACLLNYIKFCVSFQIHQWIQTGVTVRKLPIWVKFDDFWSHVTFKIDVWPWKTIGHLFYATSSFVHHFVAIGEFKLELQSGNAQFESKSTIFRAVWPYDLTFDLENNRAPLFYATSTFVHHFVAIGEFKLELQSGNGQCGAKLTIFCSRMTLQFDIWPWKSIGHLFYSSSSFVHRFVAIGVYKLELQSGNAQFWSNSTIFRAVWHWNLTDDLEKQ